MEIWKQRKKSAYLRTYEALGKRMMLTKEDQRHLLNMLKGYAGEVWFDELVKLLLTAEAIVLCDLTYTDKGSSFQVDLLIVLGGKVVMFEVKNMEGNFQYHPHHFMTSFGKKISNPLVKFEDSKIKMETMLRNMGIRLPLEARLVFVNSSFTLYNAPPEAPVLYRGQLESYLSQLNESSGTLTQEHRRAANKLLAAHQEEPAFRRTYPDYQYHLLKKGLWCIECSSPNIRVSQRSCTCQACGHTVSMSEAVVFHSEELRLVCRDKKVTTALVFEWIGQVVPLRGVRKILMKHYQACGQTKGTCFIEKNGC